MTKHDAHTILSIYARNLRGQMREALDISLKALAWECAYEKMMNITIEHSPTEKIEEELNEN